MNREHDQKAITVHFPAELPILNRRASGILLAILVELTKVEILDRPPERGTDDY